MLVNQYDSITGQYLSSRLADPDPTNPKGWLIPAFSTDVPVPDRPRNTWPFFVNGAWVLKPDYRAITLYSKATGTPTEITIVGIAPEDVGLTEIAPPSSEYKWQDGTGWVLDEAVVIANARAAAMATFDTLMAAARQKNYGKADAQAAGLLSPVEEAIFKAWAAYQWSLAKVVNAPDFPATTDWPALPDEAAIAAQVDADERAKVAAAEKAAAEKEATSAAEEAALAAAAAKAAKQGAGSTNEAGTATAPV
ncbi:tail fiber assembly protein [Burkholderia ubonensis]|uniref:Phage tail protein n=1 Tax=Burkholderia ubonensis TaxID=101571 RepID=A0ABD4DZ69_9BURK|nr:tail fiber assembly protein [Burkholderia ubonensis]KVN83418.1 hypothetical protein WJ68_16005 [Burkholderia ubonensis]